MRWRGGRRSSNIEDRRGRPGSGVLKGGVGTIVVVLALGYLLGIDPIVLLQLQQGMAPPVASVPYQAGPEEQELTDFVSVVLADTEDSWHELFQQAGQKYQEPGLVLFSGAVQSACGSASAAVGPFYCPGDRKIYLDVDFFNDLTQRYGAPGDFAQAYVIAHEVGHHVQNLLGISGKVAAMRDRPDYNQYSVRLELQADFLAGVWTQKNQRYLDRGDIEEALRAANQIGDDAIQARTQGKVVPHAFTHGTSEQRMRWFGLGLESGRIEDGDTFEIPYDKL